MADRVDDTLKEVMRLAQSKTRDCRSDAQPSRREVRHGRCPEFAPPDAAQHRALTLEEIEVYIQRDNK